MSLDVPQKPEYLEIRAEVADSCMISFSFFWLLNQIKNMFYRIQTQDVVVASWYGR